MISVIIECVFGLWFTLSLLVHIPGLRPMRRWLNLDGLLPNWYLFTSQILIYDLCLRGRELEGRDYTSWKDLPMASATAPWRFVWNPDRRITKALLDSADAIIQARLRGARERVLNSMPFRILLAWARVHSTVPESVQFCIALRVSASRDASNQIVFLSPATRPNAPLD